MVSLHSLFSCWAQTCTPAARWYSSHFATVWTGFGDEIPACGWRVLRNLIRLAELVLRCLEFDAWNSMLNPTELNCKFLTWPNMPLHYLFTGVPQPSRRRLGVGRDALPALTMTTRDQTND